jgi:iron complex outermembrane receptor protein
MKLRHRVACGGLIALVASAQLLAATADSASTTTEVATEATSSPPAENVTELTEIVITSARQRNESVQTTPVATTVLTPRLLEETQGADITAVAPLIPNLIIQESNNVTGLPVISLRGFTTKSSDVAAEPGVALYIDGVYQTLQPGSLTDLFDLQSLEVLRGPQGTLVGRNAPAGAILLTRTRPTGEFGVQAEVETGSFNLVQTKMLVNFPIIQDVLAGKVYGDFRTRGGYIDDTFLNRELGAQHQATVRGALLFTPTPTFSAYLTGDYFRDRSDQKPPRNISGPGEATCSVFGYCYSGGTNVTRADFVTPDQQNDYSTTLVMDWKPGAVAVKSTTGWHKYDSVNNADLDVSPATVLEAFDDVTTLNAVSEELRLNSVKDQGLDFGGRLDWVLGAYYAHSNSTYSQNLDVFDGASVANQNERVIRDNYAIFAHGEYSITTPWGVSFGVRRSEDSIDHHFSLPTPTTFPNPLALPYPTYTEDANFDRTSFEAGTRYNIDENKMVYFRWSEGYLAGTFVGLPTAAGQNDVILPETSNSYEVGFKSDWFDHHFRLNLTLFDVKYKDVQVSVVEASSVGLAQEPGNANVDTKGVEIETVITPTEALTVRGNLGYNDAQYGQFIIGLGNGTSENVTGQQIPLAPKFTSDVSADYRINAKPASLSFLDNIVLHGSVDSVSETQTSFNGGNIGFQKGYSTGNLSIYFNGPSDKYSLSAFVKDITDKHWVDNTQVIAGIVKFQQDNIGRTWGAAIKVKF